MTNSSSSTRSDDVVIRLTREQADQVARALRTRRPVRLSSRTGSAIVMIVRPRPRRGGIIDRLRGALASSSIRARPA